MQDYLKPWRRKFGVLTLVMSCVFMAGWIRSQYINDQIYLPSRKSTSTLISARQNLGLFYASYESRQESPGIPPFVSYVTDQEKESHQYRSYYKVAYATGRARFRWSSAKIVSVASNTLQPDPSLIRWQFLGIKRAAKVTTREEVIETIVIYLVPYWSIVLPLTLFSAYLLLTKPRNSTLREMSEPIAEKVA